MNTADLNGKATHAQNATDWQPFARERKAVAAAARKYISLKAQYPKAITTQRAKEDFEKKYENLTKLQRIFKQEKTGDIGIRAGVASALRPSSYVAPGAKGKGSR